MSNTTTPVPLRSLGTNGPKLPALGFGLMNLSFEAYGSVPEREESFAVLDRAFELGATFWDTADLYSDSEILVGEWFKRTGKRDQIFLATKFGFVKNSPTYAVDSSAAYCKAQCAESLKRLGVDSIDLYFVHLCNADVPIEETMRALAELKAEGKIRNIGLCHVSTATLLRAIKIAPIAAVQTEYNLFTRDIEGRAGTHILATCRALGIAIVPSSPLGRGLLTSTFCRGESLGDEKDSRGKALPRFQDGNKDANVELVSQFRGMAEKKMCTVSQLALAWLLKQGDDIFPIPGTKRIGYLEENWEARNIQLSDEEEKEIRTWAEGVEIRGGSVPQAFAHYSFVDTKEESS